MWIFLSMRDRTTLQPTSAAYIAAPTLARQVHFQIVSCFTEVQTLDYA